MRPEGRPETVGARNGSRRREPRLRTRCRTPGRIVRHPGSVEPPRLVRKHRMDAVRGPVSDFFRSRCPIGGDRYEMGVGNARFVQKVREAGREFAVAFPRPMDRKRDLEYRGDQPNARRVLDVAQVGGAVRRTFVDGIDMEKDRNLPNGIAFRDFETDDEDVVRNESRGPYGSFGRDRLPREYLSEHPKSRGVDAWGDSEWCAGLGGFHEVGIFRKASSATSSYRRFRPRFGRISEPCVS